MLLPPEILKFFSDQNCGPVGTFFFELVSSDIFQNNGRSGLVFEMPSGGHYFRVDRTAERLLRFFYSSPGTGTRVAALDLNGQPPFERALLFLSWSPDEISLSCGPLGFKGDELHAVGVPSSLSFRVGEDGSIFQIGDVGIQCMGFRARQDGALVLAPTALEVWKNTVQAVALLWTGRSSEGFIFEVLQATSSLSMLVTGLENYAKTRLVEIEQEGITPATLALFNAFSSRSVRESNRFIELQAKATEVSQGIFGVVLKNLNINFQEFDQIKMAFSAAYGLKIGDMAIDSSVIAQLRTFIGYRHRVIHVSPLLALLNESEVCSKGPVYANRELSGRAVDVFTAVVEALHKATTGLRQVHSV